MLTSVRKSDFLLHKDRVLIWPQEQMLVVADLHLGKAQTFQHAGMWLPAHTHTSDLDQLLEIASEYRVSHILFLGDFVHARTGVTKDIIDTFGSWLREFRGDVTVVVGNHDRGTVRRWPAAWSRVSLVDRLTIGHFVFQHEPPPPGCGEAFIWCGHVHPKVQMRFGPEKMAFPAFVITENIGYLPAYSSLAGGSRIKMTKRTARSRDRYFAATPDRVVEI